MSNPSFIWGNHDSAYMLKSMENAYSEVVHWQKNTFTVPFGKAGKEFVFELSRLLRAYADGSALESIALMASTVLSVLLLQKPFHRSKQKDHSTCLERRLLSWKKGDIAELLWEGRSIQSRLTKSVRRDTAKNLARSFSKLMFQGKVNAAIQLLAQHGRGGVLHVEDNIYLGDQGVKSVLDILRSKHPNATPARPEALMMGNADPMPVSPVAYDQITASCIRSVALRVKGAAGPSGLGAHCWRRLCTSFKAGSNNICHFLALVAD